MLTQVHTNSKVIENFWGELGQKWLWSQYGDATLKLTVLEE